ncbi:MAG TPA: carboxypeptidase-like regulatory domain-containing protein, partial [Planctomycetota bacterium]|nr:carboxypeptidase-like regulatory domain-containing protein [Planctomycetota bacterium]
GGRFSLPREASGEVYLHAAKEGVGTAWLGPDDLQAQGHELGDLVLRGGPALGGVVLRPDGSPLANLALEITPLARVGQGRTTDEWLDERFTIERGDGLLAAATRTDGTGHFTVKGLRPGPYTVQARPGGPTLAGDGTKCAPGDDQLVLVCNARSLRLSVVDETGTPLTGARVLATAWGADGAATATTVEAAGSAGGVALDLPAACERLGLFVSGAGRQPWSQEIAVARDAHGLEQRAVLGPPLDPGRMDLRVTVPEGGPAPLYRVAVRPAAVSRTLLQFTLDVAVETRSPDLAPGVYRLDLIPRSGPGRTGYHRPLSDVGPVVVEAGETVRVDLEAALAGRIELTLTATEHPDGSAQGLGPDRSASQREEAFGLLAATHGARVELARDDADDDPAWRPLPLTVRGANWRTQRDWLLPGLERGTSLLLDPGPVRLRISTPGYAHFETELVIEAGRSAALAPTLTAN